MFMPWCRQQGILGVIIEKMVSEKKNSLLFKKIKDAVVSFDEKLCAELCRQVINDDINVRDVINYGLAAGMETARVLYEKGEYFVPELLLCSDALNAGMKILQPHIQKEIAGKKGKIILGVVQGDIHDIGKNLVKTMFATAGWEVHDLGRDLPNEIFIEATRAIRPDIVGLSALMSTSMMAMPEIIRDIHAIFPGISVLVGGAPLTPEVAEKIGADGYGRDMVAAVREAERLINKRTIANDLNNMT